MNDAGRALPELGKLLDERMAVLRSLATSLETSGPALLRHDAEAIARGAAHQAELCRQWSCLEDQLRRRKSKPADAFEEPSPPGEAGGESAGAAHAARLEAEWRLLRARIGYLTRVHCSLLRHLHRSLNVLYRVRESCADTYTSAGYVEPDKVRLGSGESPCQV
jgi:hypothetical protein